MVFDIAPWVTEYWFTSSFSMLSYFLCVGQHNWVLCNVLFCVLTFQNICMPRPTTDMMNFILILCWPTIRALLLLSPAPMVIVKGLVSFVHSETNTNCAILQKCYIIDRGGMKVGRMHKGHCQLPGIHTCSVKVLLSSHR